MSLQQDVAATGAPNLCVVAKKLVVHSWDDQRTESLGELTLLDLVERMIAAGGETSATFISCDGGFSGSVTPTGMVSFERGDLIVAIRWAMATWPTEVTGKPMGWADPLFLGPEMAEKTALTAETKIRACFAQRPQTTEEEALRAFFFGTFRETVAQQFCSRWFAISAWKLLSAGLNLPQFIWGE